jgi:hypothetical protein
VNKINFKYFKNLEKILIEKEIIQLYPGTNNPKHNEKRPYTDNRHTHKLHDPETGKTGHAQIRFFDTTEELEEWFTKCQNKMGVLTGYDPQENNHHLANIDIDGLKSETNVQESKEILYNALKNINIDHWAQKTPSGGYHIFFKSSETLKTETLPIFEYIKFPNNTPFKDFTINIQGKEKGSKSVEIFTKLKYNIIAPTQLTTGKYELITETPIDYDNFKTVDNIQEKIVETLLEAGFIIDYDAYNKSQQTSNPQDYNIIDDFEVDDPFITTFQKYYQEGTRNLFGWPMICNFRRIGWTRDQTYQFFKDLPNETPEHLKEVRAWIGDKYSQPIRKIAGLTGLLQYIDSTTTANTETKEKDKEYFQKKFQGGAISDILQKLSTFDKDGIKVDKNLIIYEYNPQKYMENPQETKLSYLYVQVTDSNKYRYGWSKKKNIKPMNWTPEYKTSIIEYSPQRNSKIGQLAEDDDIPKEENSIKHFIQTISTNQVSNLLTYYINRNLDLLKDYTIKKEITNQKAGILTIPFGDEKKYTINDTIKNKILTKQLQYDKQSHDYILQPIGNITNFAIQKYEKQKDITQTQEIRYRITTSQGEKLIFENIPSLMEELRNEPGKIVGNTLVFDSINRIMGEISQKKTLYSAADGIFKYNDQLYYCLENEPIEIKGPTKEQIKNAKQVLIDIYENISFKDKNKLTYLVKWFTLAPFTYILKQHNKIYSGVYLWGESNSGKTSISRALSQIWRHTNEKPGTAVVSEAQLGKSFAESGFPLILNETKQLFNSKRLDQNQKNIEFFKNALETLFSREPHKHQKRETVKIPSYSTVCLSANEDPDLFIESLIKRLVPIAFTVEDLSTDNGEKWKKIFNTNSKNPRFTQLKYIGDLFFLYAQKNQKSLINNHDKFYNKFIDELFDTEYATIFKNTNLQQEQMTEPERIRTLIVNELIEERNKQSREFNIKQKVLNMLEEEENDNNIRYGPNISIIDEIKYLSKENYITGVHYKPKGKHNECLIIQNSFLDKIKRKHTIENLTIPKIREVFKSKYSSSVRTNDTNLTRVATISILKIRELIEYNIEDD